MFHNSLYKVGKSLTGLLLGLGIVASGFSQALAEESNLSLQQAQNPQPSPTSDVVTRQSMSDGVYLYGQSPDPEQIGSAYMVFEVNQNRVVGAFYMPYSSFDCFNGEFQGEQLALNIVNSYEQTVYPYAVALISDTSVASTDPNEAIAPLGLEGYHRIDSLSENDQRILATCRADLQN
jgi:hypothetical protein